jgi:hypothetical protein
MNLTPILRGLLEGKNNFKDISDLLLPRVCIKYDKFVPNLECLQKDVLDSYFLTPTAMANATTTSSSIVPPFYSLPDLLKVLGRVEYLAKHGTDILLEAKKTLGMINEETTIQAIVDAPPFQFSLDEILRALILVCRGDAIDSFPVSPVHKTKNLHRLHHVLEELLTLAIEDHAHAPEIVISLWKILVPRSLPVQDVIRLVRQRLSPGPRQTFCFRAILDVLGGEILKETTKNTCLDAGISNELVVEFSNRYLCKPGVLPPLPKNLTRSFHNVVDFIHKRDPGFLTDSGEDEFDPHRKDRFRIFTIDGHQLKSLIDLFPELTSLGGWIVLSQIHQSRFIKNTGNTWLCTGLDDGLGLKLSRWESRSGTQYHWDRDRLGRLLAPIYKPYAQKIKGI